MTTPQNIHIGSVKMPLQDFVVSRNAILGITKSGKTYTAKGVAEQLLDLDIPIIVFDAIGVWRYLKTPGDQSNSRGYKVVVAGGEHPDLPLNPKSAPEIVRAAIKENIPLIIDLYDPKLSKADWRRIVQACFRILLYENKGLRHVFLEESAEFAPQRVTDGETYAEVEKLARMGGNKGVGITFINQRAQELNKAVLELCDNVVLLRQRGTHAIDSLEKWLDRLAPATAKEIASSMPQMTQGDCWIFSENAEEPMRTRSGIIKSLHPDRRNPEQALQRKSVDADIFVKRLTTELPKLAEEQKENDPALLRKRITELERQLKSPKKTTVEKVPTFTKEDDAKLKRVESKMEEVKLNFERTTSQMRVIENVLNDINKPASQPMVKTTFAFLKANQRVNPILHVRKPASEQQLISNGTLPIGEEKVLSACIQFRNGVTRQQLTVLTGFKRSTRDAYIARLREKRLVDVNGENIHVTLEGEEALPNAQPLPTGRDLQDYWMAKLPEGERRIFQIMVSYHPNSVDREFISEQTGFKRSTRDAYLSRMSSKMLFTEPARGQVRASDQLF
jgi:hypothetical protein